MEVVFDIFYYFPFLPLFLFSGFDNVKCYV